MEPVTNDVDASIIMALGSALSQPRTAGENSSSMPHIVIPDKWKIQGLEAQLPMPTRMRGSVTLHDMDSFVEYIKRAQAADKTMEAALYANSADDTGLVCTAILNGPYKNGINGWHDYRAVYTAIHSTEWKKWKTGPKPNDQTTFARFIEDNLPDIVDPPGATMLQLARSFEAKKKVDYASSIRLENGDTVLHYQEVTTAGSTDPVKGQIEIPDKFVIGIPVFEHDEAYKITCRLRYRLESARLTIWYEFEREHAIVEDAILRLREKIDAAANLKSLRGVPPAPIAPIAYK